MSTELTTDGYENLRTYIKNNWHYIGFFDTGGAERLRIDIETWSDASFTSGPSTNPLTADIKITGQDLLDAGHSLPIDLETVKAFSSSSGATVYATDTINPVQMQVRNDSLKVIFDFHIPQ